MIPLPTPLGTGHEHTRGHTVFAVARSLLGAYQRGPLPAADRPTTARVASVVIPGAMFRTGAWRGLLWGAVNGYGVPGGTPPLPFPVDGGGLSPGGRHPGAAQPRASGCTQGHSHPSAGRLQGGEASPKGNPNIVLGATACNRLTVTTCANVTGGGWEVAPACRQRTGARSQCSAAMGANDDFGSSHTVVNGKEMMATPPAVAPTLEEAIVELTARIKRGANDDELTDLIRLIQEAVRDQNERVKVAIDLLRFGHVTEPTQREYPEAVLNLMRRSHAVTRLANEVAA